MLAFHATQGLRIVVPAMLALAQLAGCSGERGSAVTAASRAGETGALTSGRGAGAGPAPHAGTSAAAGGGAGRGGAGPGIGGRSGAAADDAGGGDPGDTQPPGAADSGATVPPPRPSDALIGWAAISGDGVQTTTGGAAGRTVTAKNATELLAFAERAEPLVIELTGTYAVPRLNIASNKTLVGVGAGATLEGGLRIRGKADAFVSNVIVKNLRINGASTQVDGDALQIHFAHHVWIDHCEIWDGVDGSLDVVHGSSWVTVSWNEFRYSANPPDPDHRFSNLVGHSDNNADEDTGRLKVTWHHNHWVENVIERMPRVRFGEVHVFNNYYTSSDNNYAVGGGLGARLRIENNVFENVSNPHIFYDGETSAQIVAEGNLYPGSTGKRDSGQGGAFMPPYAYSLEPTNSVAASVRAFAGPR